MRLNRGTLILIVISVVVIVAITLLSNQQASAPAVPTVSATASSVPVFADLTDTSKIVRFDATNLSDNTKVAMTKDAGGVWTVIDATNVQTLATDQTKASTAVNSMAGLIAADKFETDKLADFGLNTPKYKLMLTDSDGKTYTLQIGNAAVANQRYYVQVNDDTKNVFVVPKESIDALTGQITLPAYVASPTPTATSTSTPNPYSEVEQTATQSALQQQVYSTLTATALGTYSPTSVPPEASTAEVTAEATMESTPEATVEATTEATVESTPEATVEATAEATVEATVESTPEVTTSP